MQVFFSSALQSVAREFGPRNVHVCFVIVDGTIATDRIRAMFTDKAGQPKGWLDDPHKRLSPKSIARTYRWIDEQDPSAWTLELDLRPAHEKF